MRGKERGSGRPRVTCMWRMPTVASRFEQRGMMRNSYSDTGKGDTTLKREQKAYIEPFEC